MNFKEMLLPLALTLVTFWAVQYYWPSAQQQQSSTTTDAKSGQRFFAPKIKDLEVKPLNTEVDFVDEKMAHKPVVTKVQTDGARYEFSTEGACLERVDFLRNWGGRQSYLATVFPPPTTEKQQRTFLVGLERATPYHFDFKGSISDDNQVAITYQAETKDVLIRKKFVVYKHEFKIDLNLYVEPKNGVTIEPRVFFGSPLVPELGKDDTISALVNDEKDKVQVFNKNEETLSAFWIKPTLFGTQDRYFVHSLVADTQEFVQRGFFKVFDLEGLFSIIEGPVVSQPKEWTMSFFVGPKMDEAMRDVDPRLVQTLNYGWISFISRPASKLLLTWLNMLYEYFKNYGVAIIILTLIMKIILLPLSIPFLKGRKKSVDYSRKLKLLEDRYKNDPEGLKKARADLVVKQMGPMLVGCLPMLSQIPLFVALSWVLSNSIELYKAPFLWISDLSARDPYFILPILTGLAMWYMSSQNPDPKQKAQSLIMAIVVAAFFANLAAGLVLYLCVNFILTGLQQQIVK